MRLSIIILIINCFSTLVYAQRPHLEVGATIGASQEIHKDVLNTSPVENLMVQSAQFDLLTRLSKMKFGIELNAGLDRLVLMQVDYINDDYNGAPAITNLQLTLLPYFYLIKSSKYKWDVQLGVENKFRFQDKNRLPMPVTDKSWELVTVAATNFTYKYYLVGAYITQGINSYYNFDSKYYQLGGRVGMIF